MKPIISAPATGITTTSQPRCGTAAGPTASNENRLKKDMFRNEGNQQQQAFAQQTNAAATLGTAAIPPIRST